MIHFIYLGSCANCRHLYKSFLAVLKAGRAASAERQFASIARGRQYVRTASRQENWDILDYFRLKSRPSTTASAKRMLLPHIGQHDPYVQRGSNTRPGMSHDIVSRARRPALMRSHGSRTSRPSCACRSRSRRRGSPAPPGSCANGGLHNQNHANLVEVSVSAGMLAGIHDDTSNT